MTFRQVSSVIVLSLALVGCGDEPSPQSAPATAPSVPSPAPSATGPVRPSPSPSGTATPSPATAGAKGGVVLGGEDLGVTRIGAAMDEAVRSVSTVLGEPDEDPAATVSCIQSEREVRWGELVLAEADGRLTGWRSTSTTLQTPSGVSVGTPLSAFESLLGDALERYPANPDSGPTFAVQDVDLLGGLSSEDDDAVVTALFSSFCSGP